MKTTFYPAGVCSKQIDIDLEDGVIRSLSVTGGCNGNLKFISNLLANKIATEVIALLRGTPCRDKATSCPDQISIALEQALEDEKNQREAEKKTYSSGLEFDMSLEFMFDKYKYLQKINSPIYGVNDASELVVRPVNFDMLCYLLMSEGTHMILFGGVWSNTTQSVIDRINFMAKKHGVDTVYLFDFSPDGTAEATIKQDITAQASYNGPGKKPANAFADFNYIYGELVSRHLTNLNDWVKNKVGGGRDITYLNLYQDAVAVPELREPFLFLFNKDNRVDHSGFHDGEDGSYPILWAVELEAYRDRIDGQLYSDPAKHDASTLLSDFDAQLEASIFCHVEGLTPYSPADYLWDAFRMNQRGHSFKTEDAFKKGEQINLQAISFQELHWLVQQKGSFIILLAGPWCAFSQGAVATVNDYAVANQARVYVFDTRLDSKHPIDFWKYPRQNELKLSHPALLKYYVELWEKYFPRAEIKCKLDPSRHWDRLTLTYTDESGKDHTVLTVGIPFLLSYNKDHVNRAGRLSPILASRHDSGELINCSDLFVYYEPIYKDFKAGVYYVFYAYMESLGRKACEISVDRTAPIVAGQPVRHTETKAYHKTHDWYAERRNDTDSEEDCYDCC
ncbi:MAG: TIGR03905 family TSCPD domain-containing protein [Clostridiales bacterium]|nr:TIGR03905 family TSCPD domain-containing protein [Clostridiales bacterium]